MGVWTFSSFCVARSSCMVGRDAACGDDHARRAAIATRRGEGGMRRQRRLFICIGVDPHYGLSFGKALQKLYLMPRSTAMGGGLERLDGGLFAGKSSRDRAGKKRNLGDGRRASELRNRECLLPLRRSRSISDGWRAIGKEPWRVATPTRIVDTRNLKLSRKLQDHPADPRCIPTIDSEGYELVG